MISASQRDRAQFMLDEIAWLALFIQRDQFKCFEAVHAARTELVFMLQQHAPAHVQSVLAHLDRLTCMALFPSDRKLGIDAADLMRAMVLRVNVEAQLDDATEPEPPGG